MTRYITKFERALTMIEEALPPKTKTLWLAKLCGWVIDENDYGTVTYVKSPAHPHTTSNLYDPVFMFLAWEVLNFAHEEYLNGEDWMDGFFTWFENVAWWQLPGKVAQTLWLDRILAHAFEAGKITVEIGGTK